MNAREADAGVVGALSTDSNFVYDIGAHRGEDTAFYLKKGFRVVAVEANPDLVTMLERKFADEIASGQLTLIGCAVAKKNGTATFFVNNVLSEWGTICSDWADRNTKMGMPSKKIEVQARTFSSILAEHGMPRYLKVDVEGVDMECIRSLHDFECRPDFISLESNKVSWAALLEEFSTLESLGYRKFKVVKQQAVPSQKEPSPAREGKTTGHQFNYGSSGLFGEDLPGDWLTTDEALALYRRIFFRYRHFGDNTLANLVLRQFSAGKKFIQEQVGWYDTHAAR